LVQKPYATVYHTFGMLLHYLGRLEINIWWKLHCALTNAFYFISFSL